MPESPETVSSESGGKFARLVFHRGEGRSLMKDILRPTTLIGSGQGCNIQLVDPEISRSHCVITFDNGDLRIRDLRSGSGVVVNDSPVEVQSLRNGDRVDLGSFQATVETNLVASEAIVAQQMKELQSRQADIDLARDDLHLEREEFREELNQFRTEQKQFTENLNAFEMDRRALELAKEADADAAEKREADRRQLQTRCQKLTESAEQLEQANGRLKDELQQVNKMAESLANNLSALQEENRLASEREISLSQEVESLRSELTTQQREVERWRERTQQAEATFEEACDEIASLQSRIEEFEVSSQEVALIAEATRSQSQGARGVGRATESAISSVQTDLERHDARLEQDDPEVQRELLAADRARFLKEVEEFEELQQRFRDDMILMETFRQPLKPKNSWGPLTMRGLTIALFQCVAAIALTGALGYLLGWLIIN